MLYGPVRRVVTTLILAGLACSGCSDDDPAEAPEPRISDAGTLVAVHEYSDGTIREYAFQGITFFGDIRVSDFEYALSVVEPRYLEGEVLLSVSNSRVFPASLTNAVTAPADGFALETCTADSVVFCDEGRHFVFMPTGDGFGLAPILSWLIRR